MPCPAVRLRVSENCQETKMQNTAKSLHKYIHLIEMKAWQLTTTRASPMLQYLISDQIDYQIGVHYLIKMQMLHALSCREARVPENCQNT